MQTRARARTGDPSERAAFPLCHDSRWNRWTDATFILMLRCRGRGDELTQPSWVYAESLPVYLLAECRSLSIFCRRQTDWYGRVAFAGHRDYEDGRLGWMGGRGRPDPYLLELLPRCWPGWPEKLHTPPHQARRQRPLKLIPGGDRNKAGKPTPHRRCRPGMVKKGDAHDFQGSLYHRRRDRANDGWTR